MDLTEAEDIKKNTRIHRRGPGNKMAEEYVNMEYIYLHGYPRNILSDTEVHSVLQLRVGRST